MVSTTLKLTLRGLAGSIPRAWLNMPRFRCLMAAKFHANETQQILHPLYLIRLRASARETRNDAENEQKHMALQVNSEPTMIDRSSPESPANPTQYTTSCYASSLSLAYHPGPG
jgi:hypothetical protein